MKLPLPDFKKLLALYQRLSRREKLIAYACGTLLMLMGFDRLIVAPLSARMAELDKAISDKEAGISKNARILKLRDRIKEERLKYAPMVNKIEFGEQDVSLLLKAIENVAGESSVNLLNVKPGGKKELTGSLTYLVTLNCEGTMQDLVKFAYKLESSSRLLLITKFQMNPKSKGSQTVAASMSVHKIIME